jgi:hypothetical protein
LISCRSRCPLDRLMEHDGPEGEVASGDDMPRFFNAHSRELLGHCAAIVAKGGDGRVIAKGTATFAMLGDRRFVLTAKHVTDELMPNATLLLPPTMPNGEAIVGSAKPPAEVDWVCKPLWASDALDVAIVEPPAFDPTLVTWFDLASSHPRAQKVREVWRQYSSDESSLPFALCGYPDYGHLRDEDACLELLAALPLFAYIDEWSASAMPRTSKTSSQIHIEAVAEPRDAAELRALPPIEQMMATRLKDSSVENPFGGYSGGRSSSSIRQGFICSARSRRADSCSRRKAQFYASPLEDALAEAGITL